MRWIRSALAIGLAGLAACTRPPLAVEVPGDVFEIGEVGEEVTLEIRLEGVPAGHMVALVLERDRPGHVEGDPSSELYFGSYWQDIGPDGKLVGGEPIVTRIYPRVADELLDLPWHVGSVKFRGSDYSSSGLAAPGRYRIGLGVYEQNVWADRRLGARLPEVPSPVARAESDWFFLEGEPELLQREMRAGAYAYLEGLMDEEVQLRLGVTMEPNRHFQYRGNRLEVVNSPTPGDWRICVGRHLRPPFRGSLFACSPPNPMDRYGIHFAGNEVEWVGDIGYPPGHVTFAEAVARVEAALADEPGPVSLWAWSHSQEEGADWLMTFATGTGEAWSDTGAGRLDPRRLEVVRVAVDGAVCRVLSWPYTDWPGLLLRLREEPACPGG